MTVTEIERVCREHGIPISTFGRRAVGDPRFVQDMRRGRTLRETTKARLRKYVETLEAAR